MLLRFVFAGLGSFLWASAAWAQGSCPSGNVCGDVTGPFATTQVQAFSGVQPTLPTCNAGELVNYTASNPGPYWCLPGTTNTWVPVPLLNAPGTWNLGTPGAGAAGSVTIFNATGYGVTLNASSSMSNNSAFTFPPGSGGGTTVAGSNVPNVFTASNDFSQASLTLPNAAGIGSGLVEAQIGYDTTQQDFVGGGGTSGNTGSFPRVVAFTLAPGGTTPDLVCARGGGSINTKACENTTDATGTPYPFNTKYTPTVLLANKDLRVAAGFILLTPPATSLEGIQISLFAGSTQVYAPDASVTNLPPLVSNPPPMALAIAFEWSCDLVAASAGSLSVTPGSSSLPGTDAMTTYNAIIQPVSVSFTPPPTLGIAVKYDTTKACPGYTSCPDNGLQLRWLRVEEIN